jgi:glycosyltransferase involved in cell wall biosynthesis
MTSVDVVVPSYNYGEYLPACIESLFTQEGMKVRALIIDDASTDDTPDVAARLLSQYPDLEYRRHSRNTGHIPTYNEGLLAWAVAPYVLLISADDLLAPGALKRAVDQMEPNREIGMVCGMALLFESRDDIVRAPTARSPSLPDGPDVQIFPTAQLLLHCVHGNPIATPTAVVRTELQRAVGPYAPELPHTGDMEMWMRFAVNSEIAVTRFVQAYKRLHTGNMGKNYLALRDLRERLKAIEYAFARDSQTYARHGLSQDYVRRTMADEALWVANGFIDVADRGAARDCLKFASELRPAIVKSTAWRKTRLKLRLGPRLWEELRSAATLLGRSSSRGESVTDPRRGPLPGTLQGWWPESAPGNARQ